MTMLLSRGSPGTIWKVQGLNRMLPQDAQRDPTLRLAPAPSTHLPVVEDRQGEGLALCVGAEISLKAEGIDGWNEGFDGVERGAWNGCILSHVPPGTDRKGWVSDQHGGTHLRSLHSG